VTSKSNIFRHLKDKKKNEIYGEITSENKKQRKTQLFGMASRRATTERHSMAHRSTTSLDADSRLIGEIQTLNLRTLHICKAAVIANDHTAMVALRLSAEDAQFFASASLDELSALAKHTSALTSLSFTVVAFKNAIAASSSSQPLLEVMMSLAAPIGERADNLELVNA
jgi:hypothetical protein